MITVNFFAALREQLNCSSIVLTTTQSISVEEAKQLIIERHPDWIDIFADDSLLTAVNHNIVDTKFIVNSGDELAFFPPVTGG